MDERGWQMVAWGLAAVVAAILGVRLLGSQQAPPPVRVGAISATGPSHTQPRSTGPYVHVAGAVRRPGLYRLAEGARVAAAVERAGGPTPAAQLSAINLAARLEDGQQVVVPRRAPAGAAAGTVAEADAPISLGTATAEQLEELDGIGPTLAQRIVEHREEHGGFGSIDGLADVEGIGEKRLDALKQALTP